MFYENTYKSNSCPYFAKKRPVIDQGWSIFPNDYLENYYSGKNS